MNRSEFLDKDQVHQIFGEGRRRTSLGDVIIHITVIIKPQRGSCTKSKQISKTGNKLRKLVVGYVLGYKVFCDHGWEQMILM